MRLFLILAVILCSRMAFAKDRPNVLIAISDDQSWIHTSAAGDPVIKTPAFDRVAREGMLFQNAFGAAPGCSPCRAALLTGRHIWQIEHAGTHASSFGAKYQTFPEVLADNGYFVGYTGKGWGPGNFAVDGRKQNPAGPNFSKHKTTPPYKGISRTDYARNFEQFMDEKPDDEPFCFWLGGHEPHRGFEKGSGLKSGKSLDDVRVPKFLPDHEEIRSDILDYLTEIEWFDSHLGTALDLLQQRGELDNTIVIVTSDNGMAFPRAKANCYEYGSHMPLAIRWGDRIKPGRSTTDLVNFVDLTSTIYEATNAKLPDDLPAISGRSLVPLITGSGRFKDANSGVIDDSRDAAFFGRERHSSSRYQTLGYPQRAIRTRDYLLIRNFRPERSPAGPGQKLKKDGTLGPEHDGYHDIDACPSLTFLIQHRDDPEFAKYYHSAVDHRPEFEMFDIKSDPACMHNLAYEMGYKAQRRELESRLDSYLKETQDPRVLNGGDIFETYRRYSSRRAFPMPEHVLKRWNKMQSEGWVPLFNGSNLDSWRASEPSDSFEVVNGMIKARAKRDQSHLFYEFGDDGPVEDFELIVEGMTTPGSNGGIYFHTTFQKEGFPNDGHEVQMNHSHKNKTKTGSLFSVVNLAESPVPDNVFFKQHIKVVGKLVVIKVNDETVVDYVEPDDYQHPKYTERNIDRGTFALQAHDPGSTVYFREIWLRRLPR